MHHCSRIRPIVQTIGYWSRTLAAAMLCSIPPGCMPVSTPPPTEISLSLTACLGAWKILPSILRVPCAPLLAALLDRDDMGCLIAAIGSSSSNIGVLIIPTFYSSIPPIYRGFDLAVLTYPSASVVVSLVNRLHQIKMDFELRAVRYRNSCLPELGHPHKRKFIN